MWLVVGDGLARNSGSSRSSSGRSSGEGQERQEPGTHTFSRTRTHERGARPQHGLSSNMIALITSDCVIMRPLSFKLP